MKKFFLTPERKFASLLVAIFAFCACTMLGQAADTTGHGAPTGDDVTSFLKVIFSVLASLGVKISPSWSAFIFLIIPILWRWFLVKRLKRTIKENQEIAAHNNNVAAGTGKEPVEHVGAFKKFINWVKRKNK